VERAFYFWHKTEGCTGLTLDCNYQRCKAATQSAAAENQKNPQITPKSRALQYQKVDNHILLLHIVVKHLSGHPSVSTLVLPMLRLLITKKRN